MKEAEFVAIKDASCVQLVCLVDAFKCKVSVMRIPLGIIQLVPVACSGSRHETIATTIRPDGAALISCIYSHSK